MKLAKRIDGAIVLLDVENGKEVGGDRTEAELYREGWKKACLTEKPCPDAIERWVEYPTCWVQEWDVPEPEPEPGL